MTEEKENIKLTKIQIKKSHVHIEFKEKEGEENYVTEFDCDAPANPEFPKALADLGKAMCDTMQFTEEQKNACTATSVALSYSADEHNRMGVMVAMSMTLENFSGPLHFNTPLIKEKTEEGKGGGRVMSDSLRALVGVVIDEANKYMKGNRAQKKLFDQDGNEMQFAPEDDTKVEGAVGHDIKTGEAKPVIKDAEKKAEIKKETSERLKKVFG